MKICYIDVETTGLFYNKHGIIQIAGLIEIDGEVIDAFDLKLNPLPDCEFDPQSTSKHGLEPTDLFNHKHTIDDFKSILHRHINKYDPEDKFVLCGYNVGFDINFLKALWKKNGDKYFFSCFDSNQIMDIYSMVQLFRSMGVPDFKQLEDLKLETVYSTIVKKQFNSHDAFADIKATYELFQHLKNYIKI